MYLCCKKLWDVKTVDFRIQKVVLISNKAYPEESLDYQNFEKIIVSQQWLADYDLEFRTTVDREKDLFCTKPFPQHSYM